MPANENTRDAADMIPKEIGAIQGLFETNISDWRLELMTTNWVGYWMLQLSNKKQKPLAFLIDLDNLAAVCQGLRKCIDATKSSDFNLPRTSTIIITCASQLHTPDNNTGAISITGDWKSIPVISLLYYRGGHGKDNRIDQCLYVDDAMQLSDLFAQVYNEFPNKTSWTPRLTE